MGRYDVETASSLELARAAYAVVTRCVEGPGQLGGVARHVGEDVTFSYYSSGLLSSLL